MRSIAKKNTSLEVFWYMLSRLLLYASLTPAALAALASDALRRLAVFFLSKPFLTALSSSLWAWLSSEGLGAGLDGALGSNVTLAASSRLLHAFDS